RLWGWGPAKEALPGLKALAYVYRHPDRARTTPKYDILRAYGIADDDIVFTDRPVRLRSLIGATDMWHNNQPYSVHPDLPTVWRRIAEGLPRPDAPQFDRIFVGRGSKYRRRTCRNASAVEQLFADHGYEIIYPEKWSLPQQAQIFGRSRVIAGFGGSGLFNMLFAQRLEAMIILNQDSYYHRNEHLFTALLGPEVHYFWSAADLPQDASGQNLQASESDWDFDMSRHGPELRSLLRRLS
ncbi:MAG: glycosyltransferase family 61 protein, partial [Rhodococcus sp.]|nr:glycosyltransferase family 61 protein [Rhodococcus sp. (in: high G+C Gram-positive bacteria)]